MARKLGLDPRPLIEDDSVRFLWRDEARFKHLATEDQLELAGITSFGRAVATALTGVSEAVGAGLEGRTAAELRTSIMGTGRPFVGLVDLLSLCWALGVPVAHLRVFPWSQKRMAAMTVAIADRWSVLLGKDSVYPAPIAFYLAHEIGHIALGHVGSDEILVDLEGPDLRADADDDEEQAADAFGLELLTGHAAPVVLNAGAAPSATELSRIAVESAAELQIEPGTLALCFAYSTGEWAIANAALKRIYDEPLPVWGQVNGVAIQQLSLAQASTDTADYLSSVLGRELD